MTLRLYLLRHGETEWSLSGQHTGTSDIPLTEQGEDDARRLAPRLSGITFAHVLSSPRQRALRTCALAGLGASVVVEPDLAEWNYGEYEGRRSSEIHRDRPDWMIFRDGCPNGETPAQIADRADRLIARLETMGGDIALFSHGHFSCVLATRWIGVPVVEGEHFSIDPGSLNVLGYKPRHPDVRMILLWNSVSD